MSFSAYRLSVVKTRACLSLTSVEEAVADTQEAAEVLAAAEDMVVAGEEVAELTTRPCTEVVAEVRHMRKQDTHVQNEF